MFKRVVAAVIILVGVTMVDACMSPDNVFEINFNDGESMDLSVFEEIGKEGVNYNYENERVYSYISHYNQNVIIRIWNGTRTNFVIDTSVVDLEGFKADSCVLIELEWLVDAGIMSLERVEREIISEAFADGFQSSIFWTKWDVLRHSSYWPVDSGGRSSSTDTMFMDSNGVIWMPLDCSASNIMPDFPPEELNLKSGIINSEENYRSINSPNISSSSRTGTHLIDIRGRHISGRKRSDMNKPSSTNIILEYNPETGIAKPRALMPED